MEKIPVEAQGNTLGICSLPHTGRVHIQIDRKHRWPAFQDVRSQGAKPSRGELDSIHLHRDSGTGKEAL
jgi:hypothetical protein